MTNMTSSAQRQDDKNVNGNNGSPSEQGDDTSSFPLSGPIDVRSFALSGILMLMVLYTLYFSAPIMIPITLAFMLNFLLSPMVLWLERIHIPLGIGAALVLAGALGVGGGAVYLLSEPAAEWASQAPKNLRDLEFKLQELKKPIEEIKRATERVDELTDLDQREEKQVVALGNANLMTILLEGTPTLLAGVLVILITLYFLLASGDSFLSKLVSSIPRLREKKRAVEIVRKIQGDVSIYLFTVTLINLGLGVFTSIATYFLGVPNPLLWGAMAAVFNFAPYIGALASTLVLTLVGLSTFEVTSHALIVPAVFVMLTVLEGQLVTPMILGSRLALSPVIVFLGILFWGWFWGVIGALMAVPILVSLKIVCENVETLRPLSRFMGR